MRCQLIFPWIQCWATHELAKVVDLAKESGESEIVCPLHTLIG